MDRNCPASGGRQPSEDRQGGDQKGLKCRRIREAEPPDRGFQGRALERVKSVLH